LKFIIYKTTRFKVVKLINFRKTCKCTQKTPTEIHFIYSGNKEIYSIFTRHEALSLFYFLQNAVYFIILSFPI